MVQRLRRLHDRLRLSPARRLWERLAARAAFLDASDFEVIEAVAAFKARVAGDAPPSEINFMKAESRASMTKVAPTDE